MIFTVEFFWLNILLNIGLIKLKMLFDSLVAVGVFDDFVAKNCSLFSVSYSGARDCTRKYFCAVIGSGVPYQHILCGWYRGL